MPYHRLGVLRDVVALSARRRRWHVMAILLLLVVLGLGLVAAQGSAVAPFIYTLF